MDDSLLRVDNRLIRELFVSVKTRLPLFPNPKLWVFKKVYNTVKPGKQIYSLMLFSRTFGTLGAFYFVEHKK